MNILIGGDIVPTQNNFEKFCEGDVEYLFGDDLLNICNNSDFIILNLEVPLADKMTPIKKCGPNLIAPTRCIEGLRTINPHFFTLANNHILDHGDEGLFSTLKVLNEAKISYAGVGNNLNEASVPFLINKEGIVIGIYCCAEHEFSIAKKNKAGVNPFDPIESFDHIVDLKKQCDYLIVLYHGGKECYRYPSPYLQRICRKFIDKGASIVVCQHSHCIGCEEKWNEGTIIYGQGNFLFDYSDNEFWKTSLLINIDLDVYRMEISYIPLIKVNDKVRVAGSKEKELILSDFYKRTEEISQEGVIEERYKLFAEEMQWEYYSAFAGKIVRNPLYRILNRATKYKFSRWYLKIKYRERERLILQNYIECEAHRELLLQSVKKIDKFK